MRRWVACAQAADGVLTILDGLVCQWKGRKCMIGIPEDLILC